MIEKKLGFYLKFCNSCGWKVPPDIIKTILINHRDKLYCFECGKDLIKENDDALERNNQIFIENLANNKEISLCMYSTLKKTYNSNKIEKVAFKSSLYVLYNLIEQVDLPRFVKNETHLQKMIDNKFFLSKGQKSFNKLSDQDKLKYGGIIYSIKCKEPFDIYPGLKDKIYIGRTWKAKMKRFAEHVRDAIEKYIKERKMPQRRIENAILVGIIDFLRKTYIYESSINPLDDFIEKKLIKKDHWQVKQVIL